jgi:hypothetical protein
MSKLSTLIEETKALKEKMKNDGEAALKEAFGEFFSAHPEAHSVVWTQYSPHFNDGDACTFGVHEMELRLKSDAIADDVRKVIGVDGEDENSDYGYGENNAAASLRSLSKVAKVRGYHGAAKRAGVPLRTLTDAERSMIDDFEALAKGCGEIDDVMEITFGNHVKVTATCKGFEVDKYQHD